MSEEQAQKEPKQNTTVSTSFVVEIPSPLNVLREETVKTQIAGSTLKDVKKEEVGKFNQVKQAQQQAYNNVSKQLQETGEARIQVKQEIADDLSAKVDELRKALEAAEKAYDVAIDVVVNEEKAVAVETKTKLTEKKAEIKTAIAEAKTAKNTAISSARNELLSEKVATFKHTTGELVDYTINRTAKGVDVTVRSGQAAVGAVTEVVAVFGDAAKRGAEKGYSKETKLANVRVRKVEAPKND